MISVGIHEGLVYIQHHPERSNEESYVALLEGARVGLSTSLENQIVPTPWATSLPDRVACTPSLHCLTFYSLLLDSLHFQLLPILFLPHFPQPTSCTSFSPWMWQVFPSPRPLHMLCCLHSHKKDTQLTLSTYPLHFSLPLSPGFCFHLLGDPNYFCQCNQRCICY